MASAANLVTAAVYYAFWSAVGSDSLASPEGFADAGTSNFEGADLLLQLGNERRVVVTPGRRG